MRILTCLLLCAGLAAAENLLPNGGFEIADASDPRRPAGWALPDGLGVQWCEREDGGGRCLLMDTRISERAMVERWRAMGISDWDIPNPAGNPIADTYGLSYYSDAIPIQPGQAYRLRYQFRGPGGGKVWVRAYATIKGRERRLYEAVSNAVGGPDRWAANSHVFDPTRAGRPPGGSPRPVTSMKVMLFAYHPPGVYRFDDLVLEAIDDATYEAEKSTLKRDE